MLNGITQRIRNVFTISCSEVDFTTSTSIVVYLRQGSTLKEYTPTVLDANTIQITVPKTDALTLTTDDCELQFALTDEDSLPVASGIVRMTVREFLKEAGYGS